MRGVVLSRRAERDVRRIGAGADLARIREALEGLVAGTTNLDIKPLAGAAPWHRLRVGDYRLLYRAVDAGEAADSNARGSDPLLAIAERSEQRAHRGWRWSLGNELASCLTLPNNDHVDGRR